MQHYRIKLDEYTRKSYSIHGVCMGGKDYQRESLDALVTFTEGRNDIKIFRYNLVLEQIEGDFGFEEEHYFFGGAATQIPIVKTVVWLDIYYQ